MGSEERAPSLPTVEERLQAQSGGYLWPETPAPGDNTKSKSMVLSTLEHTAWARWEGKACLFSCFCRNYRHVAGGFPQIPVNTPLAPAGVISPTQPVGLGS